MGGRTHPQRPLQRMVDPGHEWLALQPVVIETKGNSESKHGTQHGSNNHRVGWWENLQETPETPIFDGKTVVSCRFSLKPIHWNKIVTQNWMVQKFRHVVISVRSLEVGMVCRTVERLLLALLVKFGDGLLLRMPHSTTLHNAVAFVWIPTEVCMENPGIGWILCLWCHSWRH